MQHLGQGPVNAANSQRFYKSGRFGVVGGGWWVVGSEPVHDSLHVTYRLLAPGTEPSRGPQPMIKLCQYIHLEYSAHVACSLWVHFARRVLD